MRIAITADEIYPAVGGSPTSTMELSTALAKLGAEPVLITHSYPGQPAEKEIKGVQVKYLEGLVVPRANRAVPGAFVSRLYRCIKYGDFDIVHGQDLYSSTSLASVLSANRCEIPSVVTCRSVHESTGLWRVVYSPIVYWLRRADRVIAVSRASKRFCHALGIPPHKAVMILNGIDLTKFNPNVDGSPMLEGLGLDGEDEPVIATAIRLVKRKGPGILLTAFAGILKAMPNAKLVMAGSGPEARNLQARIEELGMRGSVFMVGPLSRDEVAQLMAVSDVFVLPSKIEAFGRVAVEAAAMGTPVVCPRAGGMVETIVDGFSGLMFRPEDEGDLTDAVLRLLRDRSLAEHISQSGIKATRKFSLETTARRTLTLYERICEEHG